MMKNLWCSLKLSKFADRLEKFAKFELKIFPTSFAWWIIANFILRCGGGSCVWREIFLGKSIFFDKHSFSTLLILNCVLWFGHEFETLTTIKETLLLTHNWKKRTHHQFCWEFIVSIIFVFLSLLLFMFNIFAFCMQKTNIDWTWYHSMWHETI